MVLFIGCGIGYLASESVRFLSSLAPEYQAAAAIREITAYVDQKRTWPTSWHDLGLQPENRVTVTWSLDVNTCDRYDVMTSVVPTTGGFYTYPHAEWQLQELWNVVSRIQRERSNQAVDGPRK